MKLFLLIILFTIVLPNIRSEAQDARRHEHQSATNDIKRGGDYKDQNAQPWRVQILDAVRTIANEQETQTEQKRAEQDSFVSPKNIQLGLLLVGIFYTIFACLQWRAIRRQVNLERPWIMIEANWPNDPADKPTPEYECIEWSAVNAGRSPAFITRLSVKAEPLPYKLPEKRPKYPDADPFAEFIIAPNGGKHSSKYPFIFDYIAKREYFGGRMCIAFYGLIDYHDSSKKPHVTRFCVYWFQQNNMFLFSPVGPPDWIEYT